MSALKITTLPQYNDKLDEFVNKLHDKISELDESVFIERGKTQEDIFNVSQYTIFVNTASSGRDVYKVWINKESNAEFIRCM